MYPGIPVGTGNVMSLRNQRSARSEAMHAGVALSFSASLCLANTSNVRVHVAMATIDRCCSG